MAVHVYPIFDEEGTTDHLIEYPTGELCWCNPEVQWEDPETGEPYAQALVVHFDEPWLKPDPDAPAC